MIISMINSNFAKGFMKIKKLVGKIIFLSGKGLLIIGIFTIMTMMEK